MSLHGGNIYDYEPQGEGGEILDFSSNINPYGPPVFALDAAKEALGAVKRYPDTKQVSIRSAFAAWLGISPELLVFGNGASELIAAAFFALKPRRILIASPTFAEYETCAVRLGIEVARFETHEEDDFVFPMKRIETMLSPGDLIVACQPNNPTGRPWSADELRTLVNLCETRGGWLMTDECFISLTEPAASSCLEMTPGGRVLVLRAITKDFSAPGLRVGFLAAKPDLAGTIRGELQPWPLNCVGEAFAIACARNPEPFLAESRRKIAEERVRLTAKLGEMGYEPFPAAANYLLVKSLHIDGRELQNRLLGYGILIRRCGNFPSLDDSFFRIAVRDKIDNDKLLFALARI